MITIPSRPATSAMEMLRAGSAANLRLLGQDDLAGLGSLG